jgi:uncharacterized repeat protein (TIGR01451 family)
MQRKLEGSAVEAGEDRVHQSLGAAEHRTAVEMSHIGLPAEARIRTDVGSSRCRTAMGWPSVVILALPLPILFAFLWLGQQGALLASSQPDVRLAAAAEPMVELGGPVEYRITVSNWGFAPATGLVVTHTLPAGFTYEAGSSAVEADGYLVSVDDPQIQGQDLTWNSFAIPAADGVFDNYYGVHTFVQDLCTEPYVDFQLDKASELAGPGGYVTQLLYPVTADTSGPQPCWVYFVEAAYDRQLVPVVRIQGEWGGDCWLKPEPDGPGNYSSLAKAYKRVVDGLPRRHGHKLYVQVWNEPDAGLEWGGEPNAMEYGHFFVDVAAAIHSIGDSRIKVLNGALTPGNAFFTRQLTAVPHFVESFDLWASHCYPLNHPPGYNIHEGTARYAQYTIDSYLLELRALSTYGGRRGVKVILTETGYGLYDRTFRFEGYPAITEDNRTYYMKRAFRDYWADWPEVVGVTAFELVDPYGTWPRWDWLYPGTDLPHKQYTVVKALPKPEPLKVYPRSLTITFQARAGGLPGTYRSDVRASAEGTTISPLVGAAPVIVVEKLHTQRLPWGARGAAVRYAGQEGQVEAEWIAGVEELFERLDDSLSDTPPPAQGAVTYLGGPSRPAEAPEIISRVELGSGPEGIAVDPQRNRAYVTLSEGSLVAVDTEADRVVCAMDVGRDPQGVAVDWASGLVYAANRESGTVSIVDGVGCDAVATLSGFETPSGVVVDQVARRVYVSDCEAGQVLVLDAVDQGVLRELALGSCPQTLALDDESRLLYVGDSDLGMVSVIELDSLEIGAEIEVSQGPILGLAARAGSGQAYAVCLDAPPRRRIVVLNGRDGEVQASLVGGRDRPLSEAYAVAADVESGRLYVVDGRELLVVDTEELTLESAAPVDAVTYEYGLALDASRGRVYVLDGAQGALLVLEH